MKKIFKSLLLLSCGIIILASCSDDNDSNPTLPNLQKVAFKLNNPAIADAVIDMSKSESINLTWSQPEVGFPAGFLYQAEMSLNDSWTTSTDEAAADETGATVADYAIIEDVFPKCSGDVNASKLARAMMLIAKWEEDAVPETQDVYFRVSATLAGYTIYSNVVSVTVVPYYIELKNAAPEIWYLTGACIANGSWSNDINAVGTGMTPMYVNADEEYDNATGKGVIWYAGYFPDGAKFKIIAPEGLSNWNYGMCAGDETGGQVFREAGDDPGDITVNNGGYYKFTLNTKTHEMTWEKLDAQRAFTQMAMPGSYQDGDGWSVNDNLMTALTTATENHDWVLDAEYTADGELKFAADGGWDYNWGATGFPYGLGTQNGSNIPVKAGSYKVFFNDILGSYMFIEK